MSAFAAAAITGGNPFRTMMQTWKYSLPAFLVPFAFILSPNGEALLLEGSVVEVVVATAMSALAVTALAAVTGRWIVGPAGVPERVLAAVAALALLYLEPLTIAVGLAALGAAVAIHLLARRTRGEPSLAGRGGVTRQA
jgi:TRAP-type uncharacterized transport system fused permease subunit